MKLRSQSQVGLPDTGAESLNTEKKQIPLVLGRADQLVYEDRTSPRMERQNFITIVLNSGSLAATTKADVSDFRKLYSEM